MARNGIIYALVISSFWRRTRLKDAKPKGNRRDTVMEASERSMDQRSGRILRMKKVADTHIRLTVWAALVFLLACGNPATRNEIRIAVTPDLEAVLLRERYEPIADRIAESMGIPTRLIIPTDYHDLLDKFVSGEVDLALFGGLTFALAQEVAGAVPIAMRDLDTAFTTYFIARTDSQAVSLAEYRGMRLAFGSEISTSGHLMPRYFLNQINLPPDEHFSEIFFSGSHDRTVQMVMDGEVELGAVNAEIFDHLVLSGDVDTTEVHILVRTPTYPDYVWAVQEYLPPDLASDLRDVFLSLSTHRSEDRQILRAIGSQGFVPVLSGTFEHIKRAAQLLKLESAK